MRRMRDLTALGLAMALCMGASGAQLARRNGDAPVEPAPHRTRLILKDGSYQVVMSYTVAGAKVRYVSAERAGQVEEIPLELVDLPATQRWEKQHTADPDQAGGGRPAPEIDPELLKEEADRAALSPEVAPDLRLEPENTILALDTYRGTPELVPLEQVDGTVNRLIGHSIVKQALNPMASAHQIVVLKGERAAVQMHVNDPAIYLRLDDEQPASGEALTVDTHGASQAAGRVKRSEPSEYVIVRTDVRQDARVIASFNTAMLGSGTRQDDVVETEATAMPGGHWVKIVPRENLLIGEYALVEVLDPRSVNLGVWDFGIHPTAPENRDVMRPEKRRASTLGKRTRNAPQE